MFKENENVPGEGASLVFLIGAFRSGTSLLQRLINRHPDIALMWEADPLRFLGEKTPRQWARRLDLWNGCLTRHQLDLSRLPLCCGRQEAALALYSEYARQKGCRVIGEKSPYYADILPRLCRNFPLARFVVIHRDPAAVAASVRSAAAGNRFFRAPWMPLRVVKDAARLRTDVMRLRDGGYAIHELAFEELVKDPDMSVAAIWAFLGVDSNPVRLADPDVRALPPGNHHDKAKQGAIEQSRAAAVTGCTMIERQVVAGIPSVRTRLLLGKDGFLYQTGRVVELWKRVAFRIAPLARLERHREKSGHRVVD